MTREREKELMEQAISYLVDNDLLDDFLEDRDVELDEEEKEYFGIDEYEEEDF